MTIISRWLGASKNIYLYNIIVLYILTDNENIILKYNTQSYHRYTQFLLQ